MYVNNRGIVYSDMGDIDQAMANFEKAIELDPEFTLAHYNRGLAYGKIGNLDQAIIEFDRAIEQDPNDVVSRLSCPNKVAT
jgi:tetratricopeptide (TPR) repeat protein